MPRNTTIINISADPAFAEELVALAKREKKSKSQLLREAFESYKFKRDLRALQKKGRIIARKLGLKTYDDIEAYLG